MVGFGARAGLGAAPPLLRLQPQCHHLRLCLLQLGPHGVSHSLGHGGFRERGPLALFGDFSAAPGLLQKLRLVNVEGNRGKGLLDFLIGLFPVVDQAFPLR